jgi:hypothetical protein
MKKPKEVIFNGVVGPGGIFTFEGKDKKGTMGTEISVFIDGLLNTTIHTSCSQPIGPGLIKGLFTVVDGYSREGGRLCPVVPEPEICGCEGKVTQLTLKYTGSIGSTIRVEMKKPEEVIFEEFVNPGEEFTFEGNDKNGTMGTEISVYINDLLNTTIHTSCSQPIGPGLIKGLFTVVDGYSREGGRLCPISAAKRASGQPSATLLIDNAPNPFNPSTTITFSIPETGYVTLKIYNSLGNEVATLVDKSISAGKYSVDWNARSMASGVYFCRIQTGRSVAVRKIMLLK